MALNEPAAYAGGRLLLLHGGAVRAAARGEGAATVHAWNVAHGVSSVTRGERWSLILFCHARAAA